MEINCHGGLIPLRGSNGASIGAGCPSRQEQRSLPSGAFLHGRIGLKPSAEAVIDLIQAKTDQRYRLASTPARGHSFSQAIKEMPQ